MVLGSGAGGGAAGVGAGAGGVCGRRGGLSIFHGRWRGVVSVGAGRSFSAGLPGEPQVREQRQHHQYFGEHHSRDQCVQHSGDQQDGGERSLCEPARERRSHGGIGAAERDWSGTSGGGSSTGGGDEQAGGGAEDAASASAADRAETGAGGWTLEPATAGAAGAGDAGLSA